ncbi:hypothetical protein [Massilia antarctica]|uniref:hypothetical protein n=1 Tax=Massilia antarctica TaxID=2765360 RepID=UPI0006BB7AFB|nr:hypothetical protein [Massilia sp. H27-R4]MCY0910395.1 hypothetical protein [Massilia sp. H27-R4]
MRRFIGLFVLSLCGLSIWLLGPYLFLPSGTTTISWLYAADTFHQCSREVPEASGDYWIPTAEQILDLEMQMIRVMSQREQAGLRLPYPGTRFNGQYIGFTRHGARYIYGNFFPSYEVGEQRWTADWSPFEKPVIVCDGGRNFWGIVYDMRTKQVEQPIFNGPADGVNPDIQIRKPPTAVAN